ncbi:MAG: hypothetical protein KAJ07_02375 [Planctomycetes bacterium]|nr:hypothetical protein [Planctomycetota bacterium]
MILAVSIQYSAVRKRYSSYAGLTSYIHPQSPQRFTIHSATLRTGSGREDHEEKKEKKGYSSYAGLKGCFCHREKKRTQRAQRKDKSSRPPEADLTPTYGWISQISQIFSQLIVLSTSRFHEANICKP